MANKVSKVEVFNNDAALKLLEEFPLEKVSNEDRFLAPVVISNRKAELTIPTLDCWGDEAKLARMKLEAELGTRELWISFEQDRETKTTKVKAEAVDSISPVAGGTN